VKKEPLRSVPPDMDTNGTPGRCLPSQRNVSGDAGEPVDPTVRRPFSAAGGAKSAAAQAPKYLADPPKSETFASAATSQSRCRFPYAASPS